MLAESDEGQKELESVKIAELVNVALLVKDTTPGSQERSSDATGMTLVSTPGRTAVVCTRSCRLQARRVALLLQPNSRRGV